MKKIFFLIVTAFSAFTIFAERSFLKLEMARKCPADFNQYWDGELERQRKEVPLNKAKIIRVEVPEKAPKGFRLWDVTIPSMSEVPVRGYLTIPIGAKEKSLPIYVRYGGVGTKSAPIFKFKGAISFSVNPNGCDNGKDEEYYDNFFKTTAKDYMYRNWFEKEKNFFHGQIMRVARSLEWVKTLPEWNKKDIAVQGQSMGGFQALIAPAVDKDVTLCAPEDPGLCEHGSIYKNRKSSFPFVINYYRTHIEKANGHTEEEILKNTDYFDACFFASRITCESYFVSGYCDSTCVSEGVFIAFQNVKSQKKIMTVGPDKTHCRTYNPAFQKRWAEIRGFPDDWTWRY